LRRELKEHFLIQLGASGTDSIGDLLTSKDEQEVKRLKLTKEKQNIEQHGNDTNISTATEVALPGIPAGPTKVGIGLKPQEHQDSLTASHHLYLKEKRNLRVVPSGSLQSISATNRSPEVIT